MDNFPETFTGTLIRDVLLAKTRAQAESDAESKRNVIRTIFASVEGLNWQLRQDLLGTDSLRGVLSHHEIAALSDEIYVVNEKGEVVPQPRFIPLASSIRMVARIIAKVRPGYALDYNDIGWTMLRKSIEVRNRIVHPKQFDDLTVSDDETTAAERGYFWFYVIEVSRERVDHLSATKAAYLRLVTDPHPEPT
jgi:hypothetical protein